jgi:toxin FitB
LRRWIDSKVLKAFADRIVPVDTAIAQRCARLQVPDPKSERDALIAASALVHRLRLVTRNVHDFQSMHVALLNPWA